VLNKEGPLTRTTHGNAIPWSVRPCGNSFCDRLPYSLAAAFVAPRRTSSHSCCKTTTSLGRARVSPDGLSGGLRRSPSSRAVHRRFGRAAEVFSTPSKPAVPGLRSLTIITRPKRYGISWSSLAGTVVDPKFHQALAAICCAPPHAVGLAETWRRPEAQKHQTRGRNARLVVGAKCLSHSDRRQTLLFPFALISLKKLSLSPSNLEHLCKISLSHSLHHFLSISLNTKPSSHLSHVLQNSSSRHSHQLSIISLTRISLHTIAHDLELKTIISPSPDLQKLRSSLNLRSPLTTPPKSLLHKSTAVCRGFKAIALARSK